MKKSAFSKPTGLGEGGKTLGTRARPKASNGAMFDRDNDVVLEMLGEEEEARARLREEEDEDSDASSDGSDSISGDGDIYPNGDKMPVKRLPSDAQ
jgi:hypothetical protein